jgi:putative IMPACT (imprinted ancient) family translation regulator
LGNAYKLSAADAINHAKIIERMRYAYFTLEYGYPMDKKIKFWLKSIEGKILSQDFTGNIKTSIAIPKSLNSGFSDLLQKESLTQQWQETIDCHWTGTDPF